MQRRKQGFDSGRAAVLPSPRWLVADTALGWLAVGWAGPQVAALSFGHSAAAAAARAVGMPGSPADDPHRHELQLLRRLQAFARGTPDDFRDVPVRLEDLTEFQRPAGSLPSDRVWHHADLHPAGGRCRPPPRGPRVRPDHGPQPRSADHSLPPGARRRRSPPRLLRSRRTGHQAAVARFGTSPRRRLTVGWDSPSYRGGSIEKRSRNSRSCCS